MITLLTEMNDTMKVKRNLNSNKENYLNGYNDICGLAEQEESLEKSNGQSSKTKSTKG